MVAEYGKKVKQQFTNNAFPWSRPDWPMRRWSTGNRWTGGQGSAVENILSLAATQSSRFAGT
jgi:hypothetical protein